MAEGNLIAGLGQFMQAGTSFAGASAQAGAMRAQGRWSKHQHDWNAELSDNAAVDAVVRGERTAAVKSRAVSQAIGSQRASAGAAGIDPNTGTAAEVQAQTAGLGALDELNIRNNAWREAFGYRASALAERGAGDFALISGENNASSTLLAGGMNAAAFGLKGFGSFAKSGFFSKNGSSDDFLSGDEWGTGGSLA